MSQKITLPNGYTAQLSINLINNVSIAYRLTDLSDSEDVTLWKEFANNLAKLIADQLLQNYEMVNFIVSADAYYADHNGYLTQEISRVNKERLRLYRQTKDRSDKIDMMFAEITDPADWANAQGTQHYELQHIDNLSSLGFSFGLPFTFNARALSTNSRLNKDLAVSNFIQYLPYNKDHYCVMHSIYNNLYHTNKTTNHKSLNRDEVYMNAFTRWFKSYELDDFYIGTSFNLNQLPELEERLRCSITVYTLNEGEPELYYRSAYNYDQDPTHLVIIPLSEFYNKKTNKSPAITTTNGVSPCFEELPFFTNISTSNWVDCDKEAHAAVFNINYFRRFTKERVDGVLVNTTQRDDRYVVCPFCCGSVIKHTLKKHKESCLTALRCSSATERIREYKELLDPKRIFTKHWTSYRTPFVTFDFETRLEVIDGLSYHKPYSYAMIYLNVFNASDSIIKMYQSNDVDQLLNNFLDDVEELVTHHHDIVQSVDFADPLAVKNAGEPLRCPLCHCSATKWEYNHSHHAGDNLNTHLDGLICETCNKKATVRNKPLRFYAHNGSRFDFSLFLGKMFNDSEFKGFKFLAKTESRFTQIDGYINSAMYKFSFNDSRMHLSQGLGDLANAWISDADMPTLKTLIEMFYENVVDDDLVKLSRKKAVFPYSALNSIDETLPLTEPLDRKWFYDTLRCEDVSEGDYKTYLDAFAVLKQQKPDSTFGDYHDFYLLLDVVLLAVVLQKFMNICFDNSGLNPLAYVSSSSFSMNALLKYNLDKGIKPIVIPKVDVQKFLQKSIHGGFTMIFNKQLKNFNAAKDYSWYLDVNSLYPSVMSSMKLPYEFDCWVKDPTLDYLYANENDRYFFLEVDIAPLKEQFQDKASKYPLFPENIELTEDMISADQLRRYKANNQKPGEEENEFKSRTINTVSFYEKKNYITSWTYLKLALRVGYEVTKIHRCAAFHQDYVLKGYIDKMYALKRNASIEKATLNNQIKAAQEAENTELEQSLTTELAGLEARIVVFKLILNAIYGQCIINSDRHSEVSMVNLDSSSDDPLNDNLSLKKLISSMRFKSLIKVDNKAIVSMMKPTYDLSYPLMCGSAILFGSKIIVAKFVYALYDYLQTFNEDPSKEQVFMSPMMTDTDSYMFQVHNIQQYEPSRQKFAFDFNNKCYSVFDTTGYAEKYRMPDTHEAFCHFKDETSGKQIIEFYGPAPKCYSFKTEDSKTKIKGKGVSKAMQKKYLSHELYGDIITGAVLEDDYVERTGNKLSCEFGMINSKKMMLYNTVVKKSVATFVDLKCYYTEGGKDYYIYGSKQHLDATAKQKI